MAAPQFEYIPTGSRSFVYKVDRDVWPVYHFHPEIDLLLVLKNSGEYLSGDALRQMEPGTLFMNGSNVPHALHPSEPPEEDWDRPAVAVLQFSPESLGKDLLGRGELSEIRGFLANASRGYEFHGQTRREAADLLMSMREAEPLEQFTMVLHLLQLLARSEEKTPLASEGYRPSLRKGQVERMDRVVRFLQEHKTEPITLETVSEVAHLTPKAFCRFFRATMGKTLVQYVNELRIGEACRLLLETDWTITEVALEAGFPNLSNFNRRFKELKGMPPREFRRRAADRAVDETSPLPPAIQYV